MNALEIAMENPQDSKFKKYGGLLREDLKASRISTNDTKAPFHWYQTEAVLRARKLVMRDEENEIDEMSTESIVQPILIVAPTGAGKSGMIVLLPYVLESNRVLVLTPSKVLSVCVLSKKPFP